MTFEDLQLIRPLLRAVQEEGYTTPTPIQEKAIPGILAGKDIMGCAQTGTGKTAAFALPVLQNLLNGPKPEGPRRIRVLVVTPTRELANQVGDSFRTYGKFTGLRHAVVYGGVNQHHQVKSLQRGADIVVATPGRLLDLMSQGYIRLDSVQVLILDEADRMLDMGFMPDIKRIVAKVPNQRQTLMFSATMPSDIRRLAGQLLNSPESVSVAPVATPAERIAQSLYFVEKKDKSELLLHLLDSIAMPKLLVFTRTRYGAENVARKLSRAKVEARAIHGDKTQNQREQALRQFKTGRVQVLVATDIASRGLDIDDVSHVVNYDLPNESDSYVHRIGRTARAGASGAAIAFCAKDERNFLRDIERLMRSSIAVVDEHPYRSETPAPSENSERYRSNRPGGNRNQGRSRRGNQSNSGNNPRRKWSRNSNSNSRSHSGLQSEPSERSDSRSDSRSHSDSRSDSRSNSRSRSDSRSDFRSRSDSRPRSDSSSDSRTESRQRSDSRPRSDSDSRPYSGSSSGKGRGPYRGGKRNFSGGQRRSKPSRQAQDRA